MRHAQRMQQQKKQQETAQSPAAGRHAGIIAPLALGWRSITTVLVALLSRVSRHCCLWARAALLVGACAALLAAVGLFVELSYSRYSNEIHIYI